MVLFQKCNIIPPKFFFLMVFTVNIYNCTCDPTDTMFVLVAGRLSKDDIERMVSDAEKYKNDDENQRERIQAKNALESYAYNMKSTAEDDKLKDKLSEEDRKKITDKCNEVISWLDNNQVRRMFLGNP